MAKSATTAFGARMAYLRKNAGYTQESFAAALGVSRRKIAYFEKEADHPPADILVNMAELLGLTEDALLDLSQPLPAKPPRSRLQTRMQEIENLSPGDRKKLLQIIDAFIEKSRLEKQVGKG